MSFVSESFANQKLNTIKLQGVGDKELIERNVIGAAAPELEKQRIFLSLWLRVCVVVRVEQWGGSLGSVVI